MFACSVAWSWLLDEFTPDDWDDDVGRTPNMVDDVIGDDAVGVEPACRRPLDSVGVVSPGDRNC